MSTKKPTVAGARPMAINTASNPVRTVDTNTYTLYGYPVPRNVTAIEMRHDVVHAMDVVRWRVKDSKEIFSMDMPVVTDETIMAVLAAMRLSC